MGQELKWISDSLCVKFSEDRVIYILIYQECPDLGMVTMTAIGLSQLMTF